MAGFDWLTPHIGLAIIYNTLRNDDTALFSESVQLCFISQRYKGPRALETGTSVPGLMTIKS